MRFEGLQVLGSTADIPELVRRHDVGVIFYTIARISPEDNQRILEICDRTGLHVVMLSDVLDLLHHQLAKAGSGANGKQRAAETFPVTKESEKVDV
jgi:FlaA1/EpsC-like NDP-sugar epimerase